MMVSNDFEQMLQSNNVEPLIRTHTQTVQVNLGKRCNQACRHCHVNAGPNRTEAMSAQTMERLVTVMAASSSVTTLDITGGAPELHPKFRSLVQSARQLGLHVIDRCNLTVLSLEDHADTASFLADQGVEIIASLPCYSNENVDRQRGGGVFEQSIAGLQQLNALGYGAPNSPLYLNLVYNPLGAFLPPDQGQLEHAYKSKLKTDFGVSFNRLYTITNMPIARFKSDLSASGSLNAYVDLLKDNFNPNAVDGLMCKELISVSWHGRLYDCDFNQMLELTQPNTPKSIWDIDTFDSLKSNPIATGTHCFGCTAGAGSSCGGALQ